MELYTYKAIVTDVYDGDSFTVDIDLGLNVWLRGVKLRLARIDTPEIQGDEREIGLQVRDYVRMRLLNKEVVLKTDKDKTGKYGRYIAEVMVGDLNFNNHLLEIELAKPYSSKS
jgi:micrococcal nuclease